MTRKRFIKLMMGHGVQRNAAYAFTWFLGKNESYLELYTRLKWIVDVTTCSQNLSKSLNVFAEAAYTAAQSFAGYVERLGEAMSKIY